MMGLREARLFAAMLVCAAAVLLSVSPARAQGAEPVVVDVDVTRHPVVTLGVDVPGDAGGWSVTATEGGVERPVAVTGGDSAANEVVLVIDSSGSMAGGPMEAAKAAASSFVSRLHPGTAVAVVGFGNQPYVLSPLTRDVAALQAAIGTLAAAGETALYDALDLAVRQLSSAEVPRSIILVSDGGDTVSGTTLPSITTRLVDGRVRLFAVRLATDESNVGVLDGLAAATGGRALDATADATALASTYETIGAAALSRLQVEYRSGAHGVVPLRLVLRRAGVEHVLEAEIELPAAPVVAAPMPVAAAAARDASVWPVLAGAAAVFLAMTFLLQLVLVRRPRSLLAAHRRGQDRRQGLRQAKDVLGARLERTLEARGRRQALGAHLERAGMAVQPGEYAVMVLGAAALCGMSGTFIGGLGLGVVFAGCAVLVALVLLRARASRRQAEVGQQLPDMLQQLTSSLRAGYGVMQSLDAVAREMGGPMSEEIRRVVAEVQLGRDLTESLQALAVRAGGTDFEWVVQAIEINREVGGDLVEVIEAVADTIRAREQLQRQIKTLSAEGRLSSRILLAMPFVMALLISLLSPGYLAPLAEGIGPVLIAVGCVFMGLGWVWLRKIVSIEY